MSTAPRIFLTPEQYLDLERAAETRSEFHAGAIFAMAGGTANHSTLASELIILLGQQLRGRRCFIHGSDLRLYVPAGDLFTYPDLTVVCGERRLLGNDCLLNPTLIAEVLSPSTEAYDRGQKFENYQTIDSLQEYLLVAQDRPRLDLLTRQPDHRWILSFAAGLNSELELPSIGCRLRLRDVYQNVDLPA